VVTSRTDTRSPAPLASAPPYPRWTCQSACQDSESHAASCSQLAPPPRASPGVSSRAASGTQRLHDCAASLALTARLHHCSKATCATAQQTSTFKAAMNLLCRSRILQCPFRLAPGAPTAVPIAALQSDGPVSGSVCFRPMNSSCARTREAHVLLRRSLLLPRFTGSGAEAPRLWVLLLPPARARRLRPRHQSSSAPLISGQQRGGSGRRGPHPRLFPASV
jgi:hypothetical protein